ncbi:MAG: histidine triad nucleotide-binding protein [Bradymonadaceae bacterium]
MADDNETVFGKIIRGEIDADVVYEDDRCMAFRDMNPQAPTHALVVPKTHVVNLYDANEEDEELLGHLMLAAREVAEQEGLDEDEGFRLVVNNGSGVGQSVFHLHLHVLGGRSFDWPPG